MSFANKIIIINGPNLNLVGRRQPDVYGTQSMDEYIAYLRNAFDVDYFQSNIEGEIIDYIQQVGFEAKGIVINAGAYTHTSIAIADAIRSVPCKAIEVHISNVLGREEYRKKSYLAETCIGSISGLGLKGYELAIRYFTE